MVLVVHLTDYVILYLILYLYERVLEIAELNLLHAE